MQGNYRDPTLPTLVQNGSHEPFGKTLAPKRRFGVDVEHVRACGFCMSPVRWEITEQKSSSGNNHVVLFKQESHIPRVA